MYDEISRAIVREYVPIRSGISAFTPCLGVCRMIQITSEQFSEYTEFKRKNLWEDKIAWIVVRVYIHTETKEPSHLTIRNDGGQQLHSLLWIRLSSPSHCITQSFTPYSQCNNYNPNYYLPQSSTSTNPPVNENKNDIPRGWGWVVLRWAILHHNEPQPREDIFLPFSAVSVDNEAPAVVGSKVRIESCAK